VLTIALIAQKGGTGKTTLALSLATAAVAAGLESLIVDLDPQATACNWADRRKGTSDTPLVIDAQPARLRAALDRGAEGGIALALIDTPARSEQAALAAAEAADLVIIPCRPQIYDLETIPNVLKVLSITGKKPVMAVLNAVPARGDRHIQARAAIEAMGVMVCPHIIGTRAAFGDAGTLGLSALESEPGSKAAEEIQQVYKYTMSLIAKEKQHDAAQESRPRRGARG
jgi:chromosome partitioning protein